MSLKADRDLSKHVFGFKASAVATKGGFVSVATPSSGVGLDGVGVASYAASPSGAHVLGVLLDDVEDLGSRTPRNHYKESVNLNSQVGIGSEGWVVTDFVYPGVTPAAGDPAYLAHSGYVSNVQTPAQAPKVGRFETSKDEDGFVKVSLNIPL